MKLLHVTYMPEVLENDTLYVSLEFGVAIHLCACSCGEKVVTPIDGPIAWKFTDGDHFSLSPSIGNFQFKCKSHYFIRDGSIVWC